MTRRPLGCMTFTALLAAVIALLLIAIPMFDAMDGMLSAGKDGGPGAPDAGWRRPRP